MTKKLLTILAVVMLLASTVSAQWTNQGAWPDTSVKGGTHGIAVDPDGKVWTSSYYYSNWIPQEGDTILTTGIYVFNADGTEASFSPIYTVSTGGGFVVDTLKGRCRGMGVAADGNILYVQSGTSKMFKIDYKTGEGLARKDLTELGSSPTAPSAADNGDIFVGPVVGGGTTAIAIYDGSDLSYKGNAVVGPKNIARTMEVSADGNTIYWTAFTATKCFVYSRPDEFTAFELTDSLFEGSSIESTAWNPATGDLWWSNDSRGTAYGHKVWYAYNVANKTVTEGFAYLGKAISDDYPRGLDFAPDGKTAYIGLFSSAAPRIQKVVNESLPVDVTFNVDMSVQTTKGNFNPASDVVRVAGSFQNWSPADSPDMLDTDGDSIYTTTFQINTGTDIEYKYLIGTNWDNSESSGNRKLSVGSIPIVLEPVYYNNDDGRPQIPISTTFICDMEFEIVGERFNAATDTLSLRGINGVWDGSKVMTPSVSDPNLYEYNLNIDAKAGDKILYKFAYVTASGTNWEGGSDKEYFYTEDDITNQYAVVERRYNDATYETVNNQPTTIKFVVDMNGAKDGNGVAFPSIDNVFIAGANPPLIWPDGGWPDGDIAKVKFLKDDGVAPDVTAGDNFWSIELTFPIYGPLRIQYKFGANWGLASNNGVNDNESGVGTDHFIYFTPNLVSATVNNVFGVMGDHVLVDPVVGVRDLNGITPTAYQLHQNYPNPFNPATTIRFNLHKAGMTTLKIYDMLGQEVASLINEYKNSGAYEVTFDASQLTSGMYVYSITSGQFVATKKMMLVK
ncbi:MAG: T9SS type A sorting domain-containing protein [Bacteroidetes bacterium]|nr:T9SS type A sorting domain-containing protein [Bacteroidota bacterium]